MPSQRPLVSVVTPCFRQGKYVSSAIDSVLAQSYQPIEHIIVNDGSDDDTDVVLGGYLGRVRYIRQENRGLSGARNRGLAEARGVYVLFLDADDCLHPDAIARLVAASGGRDDVLCVMGHILFDDTSPPAAGRPWVLPADRPLETALLDENLAPVHAYLCPRRMVLANGAFDTSLPSCEDWDLWLRLVAAGARLAAVGLAGAWYRMSPNSMSRNMGRMAHCRARVARGLAAAIRRRPEMASQFGLNPAACLTRLEHKANAELLDQAYYLREQRRYWAAGRAYAALLCRSGTVRKAVAGLAKLPVHYAFTLPAGRTKLAA